MQPYTYLITHKETGLKYYGVKFSKDADPSSFWVEYFTSSKIVKEIVEKEGKGSFSFEIDKLFNTADEAIEYEREFLSSIVNKEEWLNQCFEGFDYYAVRFKTEEHKRKIGAARSKPKTGKDLIATLENQKKATKHNTGRKQSKETQEKKRRALKQYNANLKDKTRPFLRKTIICDGVEYLGMESVTEKYSVSRQTVHNRIRSDKWDWDYA